MKRKKSGRRYTRALIVTPVAGAVAGLERAAVEARRLARAKRAVEGRLRAAGMSRSEAMRLLSKMPDAEVMKALPWWQRVTLATTTRIREWTR